jgi:hypothetical protein
MTNYLSNANLRIYYLLNLFADRPPLPPQRGTLQGRGKESGLYSRSSEGIRAETSSQEIWTAGYSFVHDPETLRVEARWQAIFMSFFLVNVVIYFHSSLCRSICEC